MMWKIAYIQIDIVLLSGFVFRPMQSSAFLSRIIHQVVLWGSYDR